MPVIYRRRAAKNDLIGHAVHLALHADEATAERFLERAESSFTDLADQPGMGTPLTLRRPELAGLRKWRVSGFEDVLIFYLPRPDGISVVRVLHAKQDWWALLGYEE